MKSEYEILICDETVLMKWPLNGLFTFNPENIVLLFIIPLIVNYEHVAVVIYIEDEPIPILFSLKEQLSIVHEVDVPLHTMHPLFYPLNDPFLNIESTTLINPFIIITNDLIGTFYPSPMN